MDADKAIHVIRWKYLTDIIFLPRMLNINSRSIFSPYMPELWFLGS